MELFARAANTLTNIATSNAAINVFLFGAFGALSIRSFVQQREIDALEVEKELLALSNKEMKKTLWDWKQQLYADASNVESAVVPLAKLKAIYGDYTTPSTSKYYHFLISVSILLPHYGYHYILNKESDGLIASMKYKVLV